MSVWINVYLSKHGGLPVILRYASEEEALAQRYKGCIKTIEITL